MIIAIVTATDTELKKMSKRQGYTEYYMEQIKIELLRRGLT